MSKGTLLAELRPLIFFDDSLKNCKEACVTTPTVRILGDEPEKVEPAKVVVTFGSSPGASTPEDRFLSVCKMVLKKDFSRYETTLRVWEQEKIATLGEDARRMYTDELERSVRGTPPGRQRRAAGSDNEEFTKLMQFLERALKKHSS